MASKTVGKLNVALTAQTRPFVAGLQRAQARTARFAAAVNKVAARITAMGAAAGAIAAGGMLLLVRRQMQVIDTTAKMSRALGIATEDLIGLQLAAKITGASTKELETALRRFEKNISDAVLGLTTAQRAFEALGLSAEELKRLTPIEAFRRTADAFKEMRNQADRARVAQDLFGRSGINLINLLNLGSAGIDEMRLEAERLGMTFSIFAATQVEAANDAVTKLKEALASVANVIAVDLAPVIVLVTESLRGFNKEALNAQTAAEQINRGLGPIAKSIAAIDLLITGLRVTFVELQLLVVKGVAMIARTVDKFLGAIAGVVGEFIPNIAGIREEMFLVAMAAEVVEGALERQVEEMWNAQSVGEKLAQRMREIALETEKATEAAKKHADELEEPAKVPELVKEIEKEIDLNVKVAPARPAEPEMPQARADFLETRLSRIALEGVVTPAERDQAAWLERIAKLLEGIEQNQGDPITLRLG
jgi:hypothetical protein